MILGMDIFEFQWMISLSLFFILSIIHEYAGYKAYVVGDDLNLFRNNGDWKPTTSKELTLLGVFFMITFPWMSTIILVALLLIMNNPIGLWLGFIYIFSIVPQYILLEMYVKWNSLARRIIILNLISTILWMGSKVL